MLQRSRHRSTRRRRRSRRSQQSLRRASSRSWRLRSDAMLFERSRSGDAFAVRWGSVSGGRFIGITRAAGRAASESNARQADVPPTHRAAQAAAEARIRRCTECEETISGRRADACYCSDRCRMRHNRRRDRRITAGELYGLPRFCAGCNRRTESEKAVYCGPMCRKRASRSKALAREAGNPLCG